MKKLVLLMLFIIPLSLQAKAIMDGYSNVKIKVHLFDKVKLTPIEGAEVEMLLFPIEIENINNTDRESQKFYQMTLANRYLKEIFFMVVT